MWHCLWLCLWLCLCSAYGFAYGFAYGIPCSFSGGRHPAGLFVLYHIGAVLVNRFRQNFGGICFFRRRGVPPCRGGGLLRRCRRGGRWRCPAGLNPSGTCSPCPGGEDHLKRRRRLRRIVPSPPVPPLLGCRLCPKESISCHSGGKPWTSLCAGHPLGRLCKCRKRSNARGAGGGSPRRNKLKVSPFPGGEGGRGDRGQKSKLKAGAAGNKEGTPHRKQYQNGA